MSNHTNYKMTVFLFHVLCVLALSGCGMQRAETPPTETVFAIPETKMVYSDPSSTNVAESIEASEASIEISTPVSTTEDTVSTETVAPPARRQFVIDDYEAEPLYPSPEVKVVLRVPFGGEEGFSRGYYEGLFLPTGLAAMNENNIFIFDVPGNRIQEYRDGIYYKTYPIPEGEYKNIRHAEVDQSYLYLSGLYKMYIYNRETGEREDIPYFHKDDEPGSMVGRLTWCEDKLVLCMNKGKDNYYLDENRQWLPCSWGWKNMQDQSALFYHPNVVFFIKATQENDSHSITAIGIDENDNCYFQIRESVSDSPMNMLCKYSSDGEYLWKIGLLSNLNNTYETPITPGYHVHYGRDGKVYFMQVFSEEIVVYQIVESDTAETSSTTGPTAPKPMIIAGDVIIDQSPEILLYAPTASLKEVLRVPVNDNSEQGLKVWSQALDRSPYRPNAIAVLDENHIFICDHVNHKVKEYKDGLHVNSYGFPNDCMDIELDQYRLYMVCSKSLLIFDLDTGEKKEISYLHTDPYGELGPGWYSSLLWENDRLVLQTDTEAVQYRTEECFFMDCNFYLDDQDQLHPCTMGYRMGMMDNPMHLIYEIAFTEASWYFLMDDVMNAIENEGAVRRSSGFFVGRDSYGNLIAVQENQDEKTIDIRSYSPAGELLWGVVEQDEDAIYSLGYYGKNGENYFMIVRENDAVIYQIIEP